MINDLTPQKSGLHSAFVYLRCWLFYVSFNSKQKKYHKLKTTFLLGFSAIFILVGGAHFTVLSSLDIATSSSFFWECYLGNFLCTLLLLWGLLKAFDRLSHSIAWIYLLASSVKFILFIFWLWPLFKADGIVSSLERFSFFIPYLTGLVLETGILIFKLNKI